MSEYISRSFTETHIIGLVGVVKDLDQLAVISMPSYVDMDKLCSAVDQAVHLLLVSDLLTQHQQVSWNEGQTSFNMFDILHFSGIMSHIVQGLVTENNQLICFIASHTRLHDYFKINGTGTVLCSLAEQVCPSTQVNRRCRNCCKPLESVAKNVGLLSASFFVSQLSL